MSSKVKESLEVPVTDWCGVSQVEGRSSPDSSPPTVSMQSMQPKLQAIFPGLENCFCGFQHCLRSSWDAAPVVRACLSAPLLCLCPNTLPGRWLCVSEKQRRPWKQKRLRQSPWFTISIFVVASGKSFYLSKPQLSHFSSGDENST